MHLYEIIYLSFRFLLLLNKKYMHIVTIIGYNSLVLIFSHNLGQQRMREFLEYLKGLNLIMALLSIGYGSFLHWHTNKSNPNINFISNSLCQVFII